MDDKHYFSLKVAVAVPALQALVSAVFWAVGVFGMVAVGNFVLGLTVPSWAVSVVAFSFIGVITWRVLLDDWRHLIYGLEDTHQEPAQMDYHPEPIRIELASDNGRSMSYIDLPVDVDRLQLLGSGLVEGESFTEARWVGDAFSRREFVLLRDTMIRRGMAAWVSERDTARGVKITQKGMAIFRYVSNGGTPTLTRR